MLTAVCGKRYLDDNHLLVQAWALAACVLIAAFTQNLHISEPYPHHILARFVTLPILALAFYGAAWILSRVDDLRSHLRTLALWSGSTLLASLIWLNLKPTWVAVVWVAFAVVLSVIGRRFRLADFTCQEQVLAVLAIGQLATFNIDSQASVERFIPFLGCAVAFYAISRFRTLQGASYRSRSEQLRRTLRRCLIS